MNTQPPTGSPSPSASPPPPRSTPPSRSTPPPPPRRRRPLLLALAALAIATLSINRCLAPPAAPADDRAARLTLSGDDISATLPIGPLQRSSPPIDLRQAERMASGATLGRLALPASRELVTWRDASTGEEISSAALLFASADEARALDAAAAPLLGSALGLQSEALALDGVTEGRRWVSGVYQAASFRIDDALILVGTNRADDAEHLLRLAEAARDRAASGLAALEPASPTAP